MSDEPLKLTVIEPNPDHVSQVCFTVREYMGSEIFDHDEHYADGKLAPLTKESDVYEGRRVLVQWMTGILLAKVKKSGDGWIIEAGGSITGCLEFAKDDRKCWVCGGWYNKEASKKVDIT